METGKPGLVSAPVHSGSVAAPTAKKMDIQTPLTAVYIHTVPALPPQPYPQAQPPATPQEPATLHLAMPPLYSKETLPFLTLHIAGGLQSQQQGLSLAAAAPVARPKSAGKHVCPHCGRDCMKPSVLEKHLRCHTGERPYPCTTCGISFKTQSNLYKHKRTQAHARLSSESEQSSLGSQDSLYSSRETCTSSLSLDGHNEESGSLEKDVTVPSAELTCPVSTAKVHSVQKQGPDTDWTPVRDSVNEQNESTSVAFKTKPNESAEITKGEENKRVDNEKPALTPNRHLPLQRQEATLFSKRWESSVSRGKSQSHESTDSGFSESSDQYPSPGSVLPDHSMDSLTESTTEHLEQRSGSHRHSEPGQSGQEPKDSVSEQEQRSLEEHISKLISENTAVVEDKQLENVRPRKTVLSKQGSIDLPMPYTYKDSFHFDMRINKAPNVGLHRTRKPGLYSSVPTQQSISMEHAPLTRSSSLPFSVTLLQPERSSPTSSFQRDYVTLVRRGSSGQINPTGFAIKSVDQQVSTHRPLVRQTAVDCNHATDGLFMNSSVEEACTSGLSCDGESNDICGEPSNRKFRRKKAQKFAYNKWYMYGGGTFKKLYNAEKGCDNSVLKARKALTNPEHEVAQGTQKRFSPVHKEIVTMTGSTIKSTISSATVLTCCLPAKLPPVSGVDLNQKATQLHSSCTSLKTPLLRNLSLSTLQLSSTGSLVTHSTDSTSRAEKERLINKEKYTDSVPQPQIPSDRKKQKTDDKVICSLGIETGPNTLTQASPSVTGSVPKQDTNQTNQKLIQLKGPLFPPCITNANGMSVSTSPAISILSTAKTNFLPKYQLKLPNAADPSPHTLNQPTGIDDRNFTPGPSPSHTDQTSPTITTSTAPEKKSTDPLVPLAVHSHNIKKSNSFSSAQGHLVFPLMATTRYQSETSVTRLNQNLTANLAAHRQFTTTPTTTTSVHEHHARLCTTLIQSSPSKKTVVGSVTTQLPRPNVPVMQNTPIITTENIQPFAAAFAAFSQDQHPPLSHTHPSPTSHQLAPLNRVTAGPNTPIVPCHIAPFDSAQPAAQNVFHVHTADLQICLQIISDEQLALIEPQIEREVNTEGTSLSQRNNLDAMDLDVIQNKVQSSVCMESTTEGKNHEKPRNQKEMEQREPSPVHNMETTTKHQHQKAQPNTLTTERGDVSQATTSAESIPSESSSLPLHLLHGHANITNVTETMRTTGHTMSTVALLKAVKSGRSQTSEEEHVLTPSPSAEELIADRDVSRGGLVSETLPGQHEPCLAAMTSLPPSTTAQNNTGSGLPHQRSQHKCINQRATCSAGEIKSKCKASVYESTNLEYGETPPGLGQASSAECCDALPNTVFSFPINNCTVPRDGDPQAPVYSSDLVDSRLVNSEIQQSSKLADMGCDGVGPVDHSAPSQDMMPSESQDILSSSYSEKHLGQFTSVPCSIQVERLKDVTAVLSTVAGLIEGGSLAGCAVQKEPETQGHGGTPGQPDSTDWEPKQSQEAGQTHHQCTERQESGGMEEENGGMRSIKTEEVLGQWGKSESHCRYIHLPDRIKPEEEERKAKTNSYKNSWLSEQHHQHLSQAHLGMSEYPPQTPLQGPSTSNNLNLPASSHTSFFSSPQPEVEMNSFYFSQQQWELSVTHSQQTEFLSETSLTKHINQQSCLVQTQNAFSQIEPNHKQTLQPIPNETFARQDHKTQDQEHTSISLPAEALPLRETSTAVNSSTSSSTHPSQVSHSVHISRATGGLTGDTQSTNNGLLDNTVRPSNLWTSAYPEHDDKPEGEVRGTHDHMTQSSNPMRADITNKYQSLFSAGHLHGYQTPDCLTSGVRPVPSCQVYPDDTSSSDDEGKLIIEL